MPTLIRFSAMLSLAISGMPLVASQGASAQAPRSPPNLDTEMALATMLGLRVNIFPSLPIVIVCAKALPKGNFESPEAERKVQAATRQFVIDKSCDKVAAADKYWMKIVPALYVEEISVTTDSINVVALASNGIATWGEITTFTRWPRLHWAGIQITSIGIE